MKPKLETADLMNRPIGFFTGKTSVELTDGNNNTLRITESADGMVELSCGDTTIDIKHPRLCTAFSELMNLITTVRDEPDAKKDWYSK